MRNLRRLIALLVALVVLLLFDDHRTSIARVITGDVVEWHLGQSISVVNGQTDPQGVRISVRATDYDGDRSAIRTGARVVVWYRYVQERYPVADRVQVLEPQ